MSERSEANGVQVIKHSCRVCKTDFICAQCPNQGWACSTINDDEDGNLCELCLDKAATEVQKWWDEYEQLPKL